MRASRSEAALPTDAFERDQAWWSAIRTGDGSAFEALFRAYAADLFRFVQSYVHSPEAAEEIVHVTFCAIWERRHTLEHPRTVRAYLFAAVRNRAHNHTRDERVRAEFIARAVAGGVSVVGEVAATDSAAITGDLQHAIARAIADLPTRCREVFLLVRQQGMSYAEIAAALEIAPKTVEVHMGRALKILRIKLSPWLEPEG
jgi:RNA polymerase sigma-70 factor (ECF subfamily)